MLKLCKQDKDKVKERIKHKSLDAIVLSDSNLVDDIILSMSKEGILSCLNDTIEDKRKSNSFIPFNLIIALAIAAKMKIKSSMSDIPYAITNHKTLSELGYNLINTDINDGWFTEGSLRHLIGKYTSEDFIAYYNDSIKAILSYLKAAPNIHILDCTKIAVNPRNDNYENASWSVDNNGDKLFGYKLASLRGIYKDTGIIEEIKLGTAASHDLELCENMIKRSRILKDGDILIMDRGFISRSLIKFLKEVRKIEVYVPMKKNMSEYGMALEYAEQLDDWKPHPIRDNQMICHVPMVDSTWDGNVVKDNVEFNACVCWDQLNQHYSVFTTTDKTKSAKDIVLTYELRPEIEEDFRQLKDFWKLEDFKSTRFNVISFHIICLLFGYLFYQLYLNTEDGENYIGKSLPVLLKNYNVEIVGYLVLYSGDYFCSMSLKEFVEFRDSLEKEVKKFVLGFLK